MRCPRGRKKRSVTFVRRGECSTFVCVGRVMSRPKTEGDVVCACIRSLYGYVLDIEVRPDEAAELAAGLTLGVKRFLLTSKAYKGIYENEKSEM